MKWNPTNWVDLQYLYYLPFCMVFASEDRLHRLLAPLLIRANQDFVTGFELKADLRRIADEHDALDEGQRRRRAFALGSYPVPAENSVIHRLWRKHCVPWRPGAGNRAIRLSDEEATLAIDEARQLFVGSR